MNYELSIAADRDLEHIFDYTITHFGTRQAVVYFERLEAQFASLGDHPSLGRPRDEIRVGLRALVFEPYIVFYRMIGNRLRVVRVLHASRDLKRFESDDFN